MSYRSRRKLTYLRNVKHLPAANYSFRSAWDSGVEAALLRVEELGAQGWTVDVERGTMTGGQADRFASHMEDHGYEVTRVPVADWEGEPIQFVAYKPRPEAENVIPPPPTHVEPEPQKKAFTPMEAFQKTFWRNTQPREPDGGVLLNPKHTTVIVLRGANPSEPGNHHFVDLVRDVVAEAEVRGFLDYHKLTLVERSGKVRVRVGEHAFDIENLKKTLRIVGTRSEMHQSAKRGVAVFRNMDGDAIALAPSVLPYADDGKTITLEEVRVI
jgi:hypothetical protein